MTEAALIILLVALLLDWHFGEPEIIWSNLPHPVVIFGKAVSAFDRSLNISPDNDGQRYRKGSFAIVCLIFLSMIVGMMLSWFLQLLGIVGYLLEAIVVFTLLAQRSLHDHVNAVANGLQHNGLEGGRRAVSLIVGRDPNLLDESGISRAAIESLAENFSDGIVAPAFWYAVFGLPGLFAYKMINTADSMIGYQNERYLWFGRSAAQIDDLANWLPARISAVFIASGAGVKFGYLALKAALSCAFRDSGLHRSPNAGWPESAMAGGAGIALGGPRNYPGETVQQAYLNASGKRLLSSRDISEALGVFAFACFTLWGTVLFFALLV